MEEEGGLKSAKKVSRNIWIASYSGWLKTA